MKYERSIKFASLFLVLILTAGVLNAMIQALSNEQLAATSELIAVASLKESRETGKTPEGFVCLENLLTIEQVLKGSAEAGEEIIIETERGFEDEVIFEPNRRFLVFLVPISATANALISSSGASLEVRRWRVNNLIQGVWPLDSEGRLHGMGENETLESVKKLIENLQYQPPNNSQIDSSPEAL